MSLVQVILLQGDHMSLLVFLISVLMPYTFPDHEFPPPRPDLSPQERFEFQLSFLWNTETIQQIRYAIQSDFALPREMLLFSSFVGPDSVSEHPQGTPADVKSDYGDDGDMIELYGMPFRYDITGNIIFGYLGAYVGMSTEFLVTAGHFGQQAHTGTWDTPVDTLAIFIGAELYRRYRQNYTSNNIQELLAEYHQRYTHLLPQG